MLQERATPRDILRALSRREWALHIDIEKVEANSVYRVGSDIPTDCAIPGCATNHAVESSVR